MCCCRVQTTTVARFGQTQIVPVRAASGLRMAANGAKGAKGAKGRLTRFNVTDFFDVNTAKLLLLLAHSTDNVIDSEKQTRTLNGSLDRLQLNHLRLPYAVLVHVHHFSHFSINTVCM